LTGVRHLQSLEGPGHERSQTRAAVIQALSRVRLSRQAVDQVIGELEARLRTRRMGRKAIASAISTLRGCRETYESAKAALVGANMGLVFMLANKRTHPGLSLYDLVQEGSMGLMRAVDRFDHRRGIRFVTYAGWWIRHAINRALSDQARTIRIPVHMLDARYRVRRVAEQLSQRAGPEPTDAELARRSGLSLDKVRMLASIPPEPMSLDAPLFEGGDGRLADVIPDREGASPVDFVSATQAQVHLRQLLKTLTPREEEVIRLRFGIDRPEPLALEEVGRKFAVSRERIRQIEAGALDKLYQRAASERLDSLLSS
jgi:RNA polymerase primary sigma factor